MLAIGEFALVLSLQLDFVGAQWVLLLYEVILVDSF